VALTEAAPLLGAIPSGVIATYPVFAAVLAAFAHQARGAAPAIGVLRGLIAGLFAFIVFFALLPLCLARFSIAAAFVTATLAIQGLSLALLRGARV